MYDQMTQQFSLSKTLRFELKPIGETAEYIEDFRSEFLKETVRRDEKRAEEYKRVKEIIDDYFRSYIDQTLSKQNPFNGFIRKESLEEAFNHYKEFRRTKSDESKKLWKDTQKNLREQIALLFKKDKYEVKGSFFKKVLLPKVSGNEAKKQLVQSFDKFTTYFTGFNENRKNIFTKEEKATAIGYRLIHDNLPKFFDSCINYNKIQKDYENLTFQIKNNLIDQFRVTTLDELFQPAAFAHLLTQTNIETFNALLGGYVDDEGVKYQGLNEQINLFRQQQKLNSQQLPIFAPLFKQILAKTESHSFIPEAFINDREMLGAIAVYKERSKEYLKKLKESLDTLHSDENEHIYYKAQSLTQLSQEIFGNYSAITDLLNLYVENHQERFRTKAQREKFTEKTDFYSLYDLENAINEYIDTLDSDHPYRTKINSDTPLQDHIKQKFDELKHKIDQKSEQIESLLLLDALSKNKTLPKNDTDKGGEGYQQTQQIKEYLDSYNNIVKVLRNLYPTKGRERVEVDAPNMAFYNMFEEPFVEFESETLALYSKTRNYLSKKPYKKDKIKLNFNAPTLLNGWDINKERANRSVLLRKDENYYLALMHPEHTDVFEKYNQDESSDVYEKVNYKQVANPGNDIPNLMIIDGKTVSKKGRKDPDGVNRQREEYLKTYLPQKIYEIKKKESYKTTSETFNKKDLIEYITYYQERTKEYFSYFNFNFKKPSKYRSFVEFTDDVNKQGYQIWFTHISSSYIDQAVEEGKLLLFQIYNKDFSPYAKGRPNLHTIYWKSLFEKANLVDVVTKLNGEAEIFFRRHSIGKKDRIIHKAKEAIQNKNKNNPKKESVFEYDIIKDRRYTVDKLQFHVPITINFKQEKPSKFNDTINQLLAKNPNTHIIGIDRGERHLLYYTLIDPEGNILEQKSFNIIPTDKGYDVDYHQKLHAKEKERDRARKEWGTIENIKELKSGYLSQIVHQLAKLIIKHNAIVVLEDLNRGFKRGRFKVEKQVYQKFEKALIDKLNYLVFKEKNPKEPGGYLNGYQLTAPFESFQKLGKQSGILFYVPAAYTSKIDPATGFIDFLKPKYESIEKAKTFFSNFDAIRYNSNEKYFEFSFRYSQFGINHPEYKDDWTICTHGIRLRNKRNSQGHWETISVDVTDDLKRVFDEHGIFYLDEDNLIEQIIEQGEKKLLEKIIFALRTTLAMRYSRVGEEEDYILSPVKGPDRTFYDSRIVDSSLPKNADANGAYHIALKGKMLLERLQNNTQRADLAIKNDQWFAFASKRVWGE